MKDAFQLPRLYAIADAGLLAARGLALEDFARELRTAGVELVQYRDKTGSPQAVLRAASLLREIFSGTACRLVLNDRTDLAVLAEFDGVHVGQDDLSPADAQRGVGCDRIVGVSTHTDAQVRAADLTPATYIAIGPAFATGTKPNAEQVVGLEGIRRARALTAKPLVAIGGITRANARSVINAGADSVAVISALLAPREAVAQVARDFLELLR
jgi:thiamine-phosphate pyrophosphorylase